MLCGNNMSLCIFPRVRSCKLYILLQTSHMIAGRFIANYYHFLQFKNMVTYTMQYWRQHCRCHRSHTWRIKIHENLFVKCHGLSSWQNNRFWVPYTLHILSGDVFLSLSPSGDSNVHYKSRVKVDAAAYIFLKGEYLPVHIFQVVRSFCVAHIKSLSFKAQKCESTTTRICAC